MKSYDAIIQGLQGNFQAEPSKALQNRIYQSATSNSAVQYTARRKFGLRAAMIAAMIAVLSLTTAFAYGGEIVAAVHNFVMVIAVPQDSPVKGYSLADKTGEFLAVDWVVDGENIGTHRGYVFSLDEENGKYTLQNIAFDNGEMVLLKPSGVDGFTLKEGETISLYALLNISPKYTDDVGELVQIGCFHNGEIYESYTGKLTSGGVLYTVEAPCDGEFMIYITNYCVTLQNYTEITIY